MLHQDPLYYILSTFPFKEMYKDLNFTYFFSTNLIKKILNKHYKISNFVSKTAKISNFVSKTAKGLAVSFIIRKEKREGVER